MVESEKEVFDPEKQSWDQMEGETEHSYRAMLIYRDLGTSRTLRRAAEVFYELNDLPPESPKVRQMKQWSSTNNWRKRVNAWDIYLERVDEEERIQAARDMRKRHAAVATVALSKAAERLRALDTTSMTPRDAVSMMTEAVKVERLSRGEPDQVRELTGAKGEPLSLTLDDEVLEARITALLEQEEIEEDDTGELEESDT